MKIANSSLAALLATTLGELPADARADSLSLEQDIQATAYRSMPAATAFRVEAADRSGLTHEGEQMLEATLLAAESVEALRADRLAGQGLGVAACFVARETAEEQAGFAVGEQQRKSSNREESVGHRPFFSRRLQRCHNSAATKSAAWRSFSRKASGRREGARRPDGQSPLVRRLRRD
jgi:hypothetical protein